MKDLKIKILQASNYTKNIKCSIHLSGKLGFSSSAINLLKLDQNKYIAFGVNEEDEKDPNLYMFLYKEEHNEAFKIIKAGNYYYLNTKKMFDEIGLDYKNTNYIFDIIEIEYEKQKIYKLNRREYDRKPKDK
jgi:hypothetical protein